MRQKISLTNDNSGENWKALEKTFECLWLKLAKTLVVAMFHKELRK